MVTPIRQQAEMDMGQCKVCNRIVDKLPDGSLDTHWSPITHRTCKGGLPHNPAKGSALLLEMMVVLVILGFVLTIPALNLAKLRSVNSQNDALQVLRAVSLS